MDQFDKLFVSLRYWLLGKANADPSYYETLGALEWACRVHCGVRKDGKTPEFQHQLQIAHYIRTLHTSLIYPADTLTAVLYHDLSEDYPEHILELESRCSPRVFSAVNKLDKNGKTSERYFGDLASDCIGSIAKGGDRGHNMQTMMGVFSPEKQLRYVEEVEQWFLPMLKSARRQFPQQEPAYENIKHLLVSQVEFVRALHEDKAA